MAAPASERVRATGSYRSGELIAPPAELFEHDRIRDRIDRACSEGGDVRSRRAAVVAVLAEANAAARARIAEAFEAAPADSRGAKRAYAWLTDQIVGEALHTATTHFHAAPNPTDAQRLAVIAVGGYGRREMAPYSDVDLLFLTPWKLTAWAESVIETMLYILWDLKLKVGHASRTIEECLRMARADYTIRTSLVEHRFLAGDAVLARQLRRKLWDGLFKSTGSDFIEAKLSERAERHRRQGGQRYMLEPNVKEGKGGLRDLQSLFWMAKYIYRVATARELVKLGFFTDQEFEKFTRAEDFLWAVRCHLHLLDGRGSEQLTFDKQVDLASRMGYADHGGRRAVEHFMQDYFRHATVVGELTRIFLTKLEAQHAKRAPGMLGRLRRAGERLINPVAPGYAIVHGRLTFENEDAFLADPLNLLRIFETALSSRYLLHPDAMRTIAANLHRLAEIRDMPEANAIFLSMLLDHGNPERALRRMNEIGALGAFIPEFGEIVAMMQFNMYHHYTVDEHIIQCVSNLADIERGDLQEDLPVATGILQKGVNRRVLYVALLLHDIGKGRPEDHSTLGARVAESLCPRLGLGPDETETVVWLVRHHLLMSDVAQKRDLSDPRTVRDFARIVGTPARLRLLTVLTVCDIRGVGPGVWNNWKAQLLRTLHGAAHHALTTGLEDIGRTQRRDEARAALREALPDWPEAELEAELARHYGPYWQGLITETHVVFARLLRGLGPGEVRIDITPEPDRDATRACFALADHPGIFSRLAGALALVGANVVDARTYTTSDGFATAVFWLQDADGHPYEEDRLPRLTRMIDRILAGEVRAQEALKERDRIKTRERSFVVPTEITFDNEGSDIYTIIEVDTRDRPGLLYDLTRTLTAANVSIASAVIATYGAQAVDVFYVKDMFGLKLHSQARREALERRLRDAIAAGAERARG
ncbi:MAG: [protein-PII] uridylyltransferase [Rhodobacteraceae bacterium]|nr:[protein-PII] uridylyltransferase [Paracoccaceae bacterium]